MEAFNFRIIRTANGAEVIDGTLSTPYNSIQLINTTTDDGLYQC